MTSTTTRPKSNSSNLLEEALNQPPIGETANFAWNATPLGIAAIYKGNSPSKPPYEQAIKEGEELAKIDKNVVIKLPMTKDGIKATSYFSKKKIRVNVTLIFSSSQALLAAKAGAAYVSPFVGRLDDISSNGMSLISDLSEIFLNYGFMTEILVASIRNPIHIVESAKLGADVATLPYSVIMQLFNHPLTDIGIEKFLKDWNNK